MVTFSSNINPAIDMPVFDKEWIKTERGLEHLGEMWLMGIKEYYKMSRNYIGKGYYEIDYFTGRVDSDGGNTENRLPLYSVRRADAYAKAIKRNSIAKKKMYEVPILTEGELLEGYDGISLDELAPHSDTGIERVIDMCEYVSELNNYKKWRRKVIIKEQVDVNILLRICLGEREDRIAMARLRDLVKKYNTEEMLRILVENPQFKDDLTELLIQSGYQC